MRFKLIIASIILIVTAGFVVDGKIVGRHFPEMLCETYNGNDVVLPDTSSGKYIVVGMAFSNDAEKLLADWINPLYNTLSINHKAEGDMFGAITEYDVDLFFIPKFNLANKVMSMKSKEKIKASSDQELFDHLLFYTGSAEFKKILEIKDVNVPYIFVIDKSGIIEYSASGKYNEKMYDSIIELLDTE